MAARQSQYAPESSVGWLDHSVRDAERMRELLSAFADPQSIDNLGVGVVRDLISEQLFPGISTIQTRARYFFFVPWICQQLEERRVAPADFPRRYRAKELELIERLLAAGESDGVIGRRARRNVKRLAIDVYWGGLGRYRIRLIGGAISDYQHSLTSLYRRRDDDRDDEGNALGEVVSAWDRALPPAPPDFPDGVDLSLTADEATYLITQIRRTCPGTLLAELAGRDTAPLKGTHVWDLPRSWIPDGQAELVRHAKLFAIGVQPVRATYNLLLARQTGDGAREVEDGALREIDRYRDQRQRYGAELDEWVAHLDAFWEVVDGAGTITGAHRERLERLLLRVHHHADVIESDRELHELIVTTERALKGRLARLSSPRARAAWSGRPFGVGLLDYRWRPSRRILADIAAGVD
ncbi:MAG: hypothetical protein D6683_17950 [Actinomyces sp.]|nr:MAG: hypothetical protein D6683_17950 [Actinomyces sp.]